MINFEIVTDPNPVIYQRIIEFTKEHASGDRACDPNVEQGTYVLMDHVKAGKFFMVVGGVAGNIVSVFWVNTKTGEAVLPAYLDEYSDVAIALGLLEAQHHCPLQMWCTPYNPKNAEWILGTGWADIKRWEEEGIITWSPNLSL